MRPGPETFLLKLSNGELLIADLGMKSQWDSINLYWPNSDGCGIPTVWAGSDGGYEKEVCEVYEYAEGELFDETFELFKPYDMETFIRRVIQKQDEYHPGCERETREALERMGTHDEH